MPDDAILTLWCFIDGGSTAFEVTPHSNMNINDLKLLVKEVKKPELDHLASNSLVVWKVMTF